MLKLAQTSRVDTVRLDPSQILLRRMEVIERKLAVRLLQEILFKIKEPKVGVVQVMVLITVDLCALEDVCILNQGIGVSLEIGSHTAMQLVVPAIDASWFLFCLLDILFLDRYNCFFWFLLHWI